MPRSYTINPAERIKKLTWLKKEVEMHPEMGITTLHNRMKATFGKGMGARPIRQYVALARARKLDPQTTYFPVHVKEGAHILPKHVIEQAQSTAFTSDEFLELTQKLLEAAERMGYKLCTLDVENRHVSAIPSGTPVEFDVPQP